MGLKLTGVGPARFWNDGDGWGSGSLSVPVQFSSLQGFNLMLAYLIHDGKMVLTYVL